MVRILSRKEVNSRPNVPLVLQATTVTTMKLSQFCVLVVLTVHMVQMTQSGVLSAPIILMKVWLVMLTVFSAKEVIIVPRRVLEV